MDEYDLWIKFTKDGKLEDYLEYRRHLEMNAKKDLTDNDKIQYYGIGNQST